MPLQHHLAIPGLGPYLGSTLTFISDYSTIWILVIVISITIFITEITQYSNSKYFLPVLVWQVAASINVIINDTGYICMLISFMLPSGTGTNC
jgi:hypothetical protein